MIQHFARSSVVIAFILFIISAPALSAQEDLRFQIAGIDTSQFPMVRITLVTADSRSAPADLSALTLQENGIPVTDYTLDNVALGIDATFIIDANTGIEEVDGDSELSRREKVTAAITRFATQYMSPDGLDQVSIIVPGDDGQSGRFLVQNESDPQRILTAIEAYQPQRPGPTQLNDMLNLGLEQLQQNLSGPRFQTILLFSDSRRLNEQLSYPLLVALANDSRIPIYGAILGQEADELELDNMARLTEATQAFHVHMPQAEAVDPIYQIWQQQGNPVQLSYRSSQRQSGRNQITLSLDSIQAAADFAVNLLPPEVDFELPRMEIQRVGTAPDTPLEALQPQIQPAEVTISWPDDLPRELIEVLLLTNNRPQRIDDELLADAGNPLVVPWDISELGAGEVELVVQVLDELGYRGQSETRMVTIQVERPPPPTNEPIQEEQNSPSQEGGSALGLSQQTLAFLVISGLLLLLFAGMSWLWRRRGTEEALATAGSGNLTLEVDEPKDHLLPLLAALQPISAEGSKSIILDSSNMTIGRDRESADIVLEDESISRLHARIRKREESYWLFDEGSASGVFLNYERLGLAPRELHNGDLIQLGTLTFRFIQSRELNSKGNE